MVVSRRLCSLVRPRALSTSACHFQTVPWDESPDGMHHSMGWITQWVVHSMGWRCEGRQSRRRRERAACIDHNRITYKLILSLENSILPPILYGRPVSVSSPSRQFLDDTCLQACRWDQEAPAIREE
eukprot:5601330-Pyramimonas_sp.AAC.1